MEGCVRMMSHLPDAQLAGVLKSAGHIVCRSGYSTIMDLHALGCRAEFIATPGQTEQEYLCGITDYGLQMTD
jgi:UDP-N-acetylglucosamine:LPS N-acetylglucosamine transferase